MRSCVNEYHFSHKRACTMPTADRVGLTHCKFVLVLAVLLDLLGVSALLIGVFVPLEVGGRDFGDLLLYSGALLVLLSMGGWVMWYSGNIEGLKSGTELTHKRNAVERIARTLSRRIRKPHRGRSTP
ncbi:transmembrane protein 238a isoform X2 [Carassius gibelio]|uniref:transmembrane protein 238a isoform X2 n=1 Tax=Carassius gibelio TaxID=101364 RepID=UPI002278CE0E|nr:transmembrane protein 238a isoform X2 [Carassius gibelio]